MGQRTQAPAMPRRGSPRTSPPPHPQSSQSPPAPSVCAGHVLAPREAKRTVSAADCPSSCPHMSTFAATLRRPVRRPGVVGSWCEPDEPSPQRPHWPASPRTRRAGEQWLPVWPAGDGSRTWTAAPPGNRHPWRRHHRRRNRRKYSPRWSVQIQGVRRICAEFACSVSGLPAVVDAGPYFRPPGCWLFASAPTGYSTAKMEKTGLHRQYKKTKTASVRQSINQSTNRPLIRLTNQPINQSTDQPINQSINQSIT